MTRRTKPRGQVRNLLARLAREVATVHRLMSGAATRLGGRVVVTPAIMTRLRFVPCTSAPLGRRGRPAYGAWPQYRTAVPEDLRSSPGIRRDQQLEAAAFEERPVYDIVALNPRAQASIHRLNWGVFLAVGPRLARAVKMAKESGKFFPAQPPPVRKPEELARTVKARAAALGLSEVGITEYNPLYTFEQYREEVETAGDRMIVCLLEQNYAATQTIPSARAERSALTASAEVLRLAGALAAFLHSLGYRATVYGTSGKGLSIGYAVDAGLGQLGLNGQLLTPHAGSRARITIVQTNAPLACDAPVDYGVTKICDSCKVCVRRCPAGAIPANRKMHRGVEKAKINTHRCWATMAQAHGCAVCMKVCPVQRFGLRTVINHYEATGQILGKDTDMLEAYWWVDGREYRVGMRPKVDQEFFAQTGVSPRSLGLRMTPDDGHSEESRDLETLPPV